MNPKLLNNLELITTSKDGVKKIRQLILELAIRGKLVPQDPNDEPASELLKKIQPEKQKLIAEGKIKKEKPLTPIDDSEKLFDLPKGWLWVRLGLTGQIFNGNSINENVKTNLYSKNPKGYPYIATKDVQYGLAPLDYANGIKIPHSAENFKIAHKNSILICSEGGSAGKKMGIAEQDICFGNKLYANELWPELDPKYFLYMYMSPTFYSAFQSRMTGIIGGISINEFISIQVPLPPKNEQVRISKKLNELMKICNQLEIQQTLSKNSHEMLVKVFLNLLSNSKSYREFSENWEQIHQNFDLLFVTEESIDELKKTILQLAVMGKLVSQDPSDEPASELLKKIQSEKQKLIAEGKIKKEKPLPFIDDSEKPFDLPNGWDWVRTQDVLDVRDGTHDSPKYVSENGFPLITSKDFKNGEIDFSNAKQISIEDHKMIQIRSFVERDDILFSMIGGNIGNMVIVKTDRKFSIKNVALFKYYNKEFTYPVFVKLFFEHLSKSLQAKAIGGAQPFVSLGFLRNILFPLPPITEQHRIVAKVDELMKICDTLKSKITESKNIQNMMTINF